MSQSKDFLVEIGTEELPPKALRRLSQAFAAGLGEGLERAELSFEEMQTFATPRRLAIWVRGLVTAQADRMEERRGPAVKAAFGDDGCPTKAAQGFARSCGVSVEDLETVETDKGAWLVHRFLRQGQSATALLPGLVDEALAKLPIPKRMRWGAAEAEFVRPVHWVVMLLGDEVVPGEILGQPAGRESRGHRHHHPAPLYLSEPAAYAPLLETEGNVIPDLDTRKEAIRAQVEEAAVREGGKAVIDEDLLEEVAGLVEWPVAVVGGFDARFLEVPAEALISSMQGHQKYFPMVDAQGALLPHFVTVANIASHDPLAVRQGNERVIRPRLADADFFWQQDRKQPLRNRLAGLKSVVYQRQLGTLFDKSQRIAHVSASIAEALGADKEAARAAATLAKCDLLTEMVGEFPELQGIMGRYYARHDGESEPVAVAIDEHYKPRFGGDATPATAEGQAVAIADKLDTITGIFAIGQTPSGDKDPFGLRRAALGALRILIERELDLDLKDLLDQCSRAYGETVKVGGKQVTAIFEFMMERLRAYYHDQGVAPDVFEAVLEREPSHPRDFDRRIRAVTEFRQLPEAESLAAANKRISNILRQAGAERAGTIDESRLSQAEERVLFDRLVALQAQVEPEFERGAYTEGLKALAALREPVDRFFDGVMVMVDDEAIKNNRLALLGALRALFLRVADLSRLQH